MCHPSYTMEQESLLIELNLILSTNKSKVQVKFQQRLYCNNEEFLMMNFLSCQNVYKKQIAHLNLQYPLHNKIIIT